MQSDWNDKWWQALAREMGLTGQPRVRPVAGGSIASAWYLEVGEKRGFVKLMPAGETLAAEADGLAALTACAALRVPQVRGHGCFRGTDWLLLEWLELTSPDSSAWACLGEGLAAMHEQPWQQFGWGRDNFIGATLQPNSWTSDWVDFFREYRLGHQCRLARERGLDSAALDSVEQLVASLEVFIPDNVRPSLLHGDLWSGNIAAVGGDPVIFDPAVYAGHSEADLAMMELFGAPPEAFWSAYCAHRPLDAGYREVRRDLYNLYHLLNHFNLFGGGYGARAGQVAARVLAEAGV